MEEINSILVLYSMDRKYELTQLLPHGEALKQATDS